MNLKKIKELAARLTTKTEPVLSANKTAEPDDYMADVAAWDDDDRVIKTAINMACGAFLCIAHDDYQAMDRPFTALDEIELRSFYFEILKEQPRITWRQLLVKLHVYFNSVPNDSPGPPR